MAVTEEMVWQALRTVQDPELEQDLVSLGMVESVAIEGGRVAVTVRLTTPACPLKAVIQADVESAVRGIPGVTEVAVELTAPAQGGHAHAHAHEAEGPPELPGVRNIILVGAGKGGVGKSALAVHLAVGLARTGAGVGLLDADVYGPSLGTMLGIEDLAPPLIGERIQPLPALGLKAISVANFVPPGEAIIWRGPMVHSALVQLLGQVDWGELDYLIIDLPPGTGDVPLSLAQTLPVTGAVVVCTPQPVALNDARRAVRMYRQLGITILGLVENMSYFVCDGCAKEHDLFGRGGARLAAAELEVPFLGELPLSGGFRAATDGAQAGRNFEGDGPVARDLRAMVVGLVAQVCKRNSTGPAPRPFAVGGHGGGSQ